MTDKDYKRKLAAILSADVKEYSRLMREDEEATIRTLSSYRELMASLIQRFRGRIVDSPGDNILVEFASVVDAVNCAVEIQRELAERNTALPAERRMEFRIGINLGDVVEDEGRIYGDGVNIAARVESICNAGGICISGTAYEHVQHKLDLEYEDLGGHDVKNIPTPVEVYRVLSYPGAAAHRVVKAKKAAAKSLRIGILTLAVILLLGLVAVIWRFYLQKPSIEPASVNKMAYPLSDKSSIAVLPFVNMSDDPGQEYFCDGITEDLITDLSKISELFVIARNSTFTYKGKPVKIKQVAEELGVRYVLEGSVRKASNQVRITVQLIDATTGHHLWADRYAGITNDVFAYQDKITKKIVDALAVKLNVEEKVQLAIKDTTSIEAYDLFLKGWERHLRGTTEDFWKAIPYFEKAVQIDSNYGRAYAALAATYWHGSIFYMGLNEYGVSNEEGLILAREYLDKAMRNPTSLAYYLASEMNLHHYQWQDAHLTAERGIALEPNNAIVNLQMGRVLVMAGDPKNGLEFIQKAMRLDPHYPARCLAATYALLARDADARKIASRFHALWTTLGWQPLFAVRFFPFKDPKVVEHFVEGYIKSGFPRMPPYRYYKILDENGLTGKQIRTLLFGRKVVGVEEGIGSGGWFERSLDGQATYRGLIGGFDSGKSWIEGDMLCDQWQERFGGHKTCYPVFRNPEKQNEYLIMHSWSIFSFSVVD